MKKNIVLIGFMGAGKSALAKRLCSRLNRQRVLTDEMIVAREGRPITRIFEESGELYFRQVEKQVVSEVAQQQGLIIDCGGGVVLDPDNIAVLKRQGDLFYLSATADEIFRRIKMETHRPLLRTADPRERIAALLEQRRSFYAQADHTIDTDGKSLAQVAEELMAWIGAQ